MTTEAKMTSAQRTAALTFLHMAPPPPIKAWRVWCCGWCKMFHRRKDAEATAARLEAVGLPATVEEVECELTPIGEG